MPFYAHVSYLYRELFRHEELWDGMTHLQQLTHTSSMLFRFQFLCLRYVGYKKVVNEEVKAYAC